VGHDTLTGTNENVSELTAGQQINGPLLEFTVFDIESRRDDTALIETSSQFNDNLSSSVIVNNFEFTNVSCSLRGRCSKPYGK
jgi:hypothetical protein